MNREEVLEKFFSENPDMADETSQHRQLADYYYDTKHRPLVDAGAMDFEAAINAAKADAYKTLPKPAQPTDPHEALRELAILRNQAPPISTMQQTDPPWCHGQQMHQKVLQRRTRPSGN